MQILLRGNNITKKAICSYDRKPIYYMLHEAYSKYTYNLHMLRHISSFNALYDVKHLCKIVIAKVSYKYLRVVYILLSSIH